MRFSNVKESHLIIGSIAAGVFALAIFLFVVPNFQEPAEWKMRAYRLSILTDQNLRELHAQAEKEVEESIADWNRHVVELAEQRRAEIVECESKINDIAYKTRHYPRGCPNPIFPEYVQRPRMESVREAYERLIMDGCASKRTVIEARFARCLPW